ncbi:4-hydroxybenzoate octaprenyltransferase [Salinisphaera sp. P385]|uniref:4-hydroxybenzoate octaprenyltransferase n=1 Tax=Spectribacter acetivorans TaxID=3075603 RepID=A0ABU3B6G0_9GAMM|nr:4-hydroxybenzoate octaprenyltransferase [Salinisphaera sp. P385]MDT0617849.1 4-hydroxybenzoate octaprenyltransferase [Salinisphaera sp. P385]
MQADSALPPRVTAYWRLTRLNRPIGIFLVGWPMLWALWLAADGLPDIRVLMVFVFGCILMRSAGCVINDYADRGIDGHVKRTRERPLATGEVSEAGALALFAALALAAFGLVLLLSPLTIALSFGGLGLAAAYPFTKRYTHWPQAALGAAFAWAVPMAFAAQTGAVPGGAWLLFAAVLVWALVYDTIYAMVDRDDDLRIGVKSTAVLWGHHDRLYIGLFQGVFFALLVAVGLVFALAPVYYVMLTAAAGLAVYHQWLIRHREREACFRAFLNHNVLGGVVFAGVVLGT